MNGSLYTFPVQLSAKASAAAVAAAARRQWAMARPVRLNNNEEEAQKNNATLSVCVCVRVYEKGRCGQCQSIGWPAAGLPACLTDHLTALPT